MVRKLNKTFRFVEQKYLRCSETVKLTFSENEKGLKSVPGFKPGLPRQNAIALPLVPPPLH